MSMSKRFGIITGGVSVSGTANMSGIKAHFSCPIESRSASRSLCRKGYSKICCTAYGSRTVSNPCSSRENPKALAGTGDRLKFLTDVYECDKANQRRRPAWRRRNQRGNGPMITYIIALVALTFLCGLVWHDEPARALERSDDTETGSDSGRRPGRSAF